MDIDKPNTSGSRSIGIPPDASDFGDATTLEWKKRLEALRVKVNNYCKYLDGDDYYEGDLDKYENSIIEAAQKLVKGPSYNEWAKKRFEDM